MTGSSTTMIDQLAADWLALRASNKSEFQNDWNKILGTAPGLKAVFISHSHKVIGLDDIKAEIAALEKGCDGWSRRESWAGYGVAPPEAGLPLDGEWSIAEGESCRLLHLGGGQWRLITITEGVENGMAVLREATSLCSTGGGILNYAVYWGAKDAKGEVRRIASRLLGFGVGA